MIQIDFPYLWQRCSLLDRCITMNLQHRNRVDNEYKSFVKFTQHTLTVHVLISICARDFMKWKVNFMQMQKLEMCIFARSASIRTRETIIKCMWVFLFNYIHHGFEQNWMHFISTYCSSKSVIIWFGICVHCSVQWLTSAHDKMRGAIHIRAILVESERLQKQ